MWVCDNCGAVFEEPDFTEYYAEDYFGVASMFNDFHTMVVRECPECGSSDIDECSKDDDEWFDEDEDL